MTGILTLVVGIFTLGLPVWFAFLDRRAGLKLKWVASGEAPPLWGRLVVLVGIGLALLIAVAAPISGFDASH